jgi:hypothetical protein
VEMLRFFSHAAGADRAVSAPGEAGPLPVPPPAGGPEVPIEHARRDGDGAGR